MLKIDSSSPIGTCKVIGYEVKFYKKNDKTVAKVYECSQIIGKCQVEIDNGPVSSYQALPTLTKLKIEQAINRYEQNSEDEIENIEPSKNYIITKTDSLPAASMTIPCENRNIKGSTLIHIVHNIVKNIYCEAIDCACEWEYGQSALPAPTVKNGLLFIDKAVDWFFSLGGWKGMMPSEEVKEYLFKSDEKFKGVSLFDNGVVFPIHNFRLHIPQKFSICGTDITAYWEKKQSRWVKISSGKTDLSYSQIMDAINIIKTKFKLNDSQIACTQLSLLDEYQKLPSCFYQNVADRMQSEVKQFLHYLNALMFGIEASGLNAALVTSLMTLDLIAKDHLSYQIAFKANADGGMYPYACFGDNRGTYVAREKLLTNRNELNMRHYRKNIALSPVAVKEAILIKKWLIANQVVIETNDGEQLERIRIAIKKLIDNYFFPG